MLLGARECCAPRSAVAVSARQSERTLYDPMPLARQSPISACATRLEACTVPASIKKYAPESASSPSPRPVSRLRAPSPLRVGTDTLHSHRAPLRNSPRVDARTRADLRQCMYPHQRMAQVNAADDAAMACTICSVTVAAGPKRRNRHVAVRCTHGRETVLDGLRWAAWQKSPEDNSGSLAIRRIRPPVRIQSAHGDRGHNQAAAELAQPCKGLESGTMKHEVVRKAVRSGHPNTVRGWVVRHAPEWGTHHDLSSKTQSCLKG
ncbi:hypothetical protein DFH06DRAFT_1130444 [Mycena polygramma]|nr:hypothetical protein DFH06DRAFT_1130444 [Mycena polygramma]